MVPGLRDWVWPDPQEEGWRGKMSSLASPEDVSVNPQFSENSKQGDNCGGGFVENCFQTCNIFSSLSSFTAGLGDRDRPGAFREVLDKSTDRRGLELDKFRAVFSPLCWSIKKFCICSWKACCCWMRAFCKETASRDAFVSAACSEFIFAARDASWLCHNPGVWAASIYRDMR